ncbi:MAG: Csu type fimbrial protein [Thermoanaerobaculia bacterium]
MKTLKSLAILGVLLVAVTPLYAASSSANVTVQANVAKQCGIQGGTVDFGAYDPFSATADSASGSIQVRCTKNAAAVTISLSLGVRGDRTMSNGTDVLAYTLTDDSGNAWDMTSTKTYSATDFNWTTLGIDGALAAGQDVSDGAYTDTVVATINF